MDRWRYYEVVHADHVFRNPVSEGTFTAITDVLELKDGQRVLDVASGSGEMLIRWCGLRDLEGLGIDASPACVQLAAERQRARVPHARLRFDLGRGEDISVEARGTFDVVSLVGASWIWKNWNGTLDALRPFVRPGGLLIFGDPHWLCDPAPEYLRAEGVHRDSFLTLADGLASARKRGLALVTMVASSVEDFDRYEMLQSRALERFAREHPDDPDLAEMQQEADASRMAWLRWGRTTVGFATWVFRIPR